MQLLNLMGEYFEESRPAILEESRQPPGFSSWQKVDSPERLVKDYSFNSRQNPLEFLRQLFLYEDEVQHHGKVTVEHDQVRLEVMTHDLDAVTELDVEYAYVADQIYTDTNPEAPDAGRIF